MTKISFGLVLSVLTLVSQSETARILGIFPVPSVSHQLVYRRLYIELAKRGHEVVVLVTDPAFKNGESPKNLTEIDFHDISYSDRGREFLSAGVTTGHKDDLLLQHKISTETQIEVFVQQLKSPEMQRIINDKSRKFDLLIVEAFVKMTVSLAHLYKDAHVIQINSFGAFPHNLVTSGMPMHPLVHPTSGQTQRVYKLSIWEKLKEIYNFYRLGQIYDVCHENAEKMLREVLGADMPSLDELSNRIDMLFLNVHPIWEMNRPSPPNVIYLGGLHQQSVKDLPKDLQSYLDSSKNGVIYVSFGTNVDPALLPQDGMKIIVKVLSKLPYDVLWKYNRDELPGRSENIKIAKWFPQSDILRHPKVKLFITQAGLQSTDEAITAGVPLIGMPMLGDQWYNTEQYVHHKIGLRVDYEDITEEKFENAILTIINDESNYRSNVAKLRSVLKDQTQTPLERAVWWTEYVLRHGGAKHLKSPSANMSWVQFLELELVAYVLGTLTLAICSLIFVVYKIFRCLKPKTNKKVKTR